MNTNEELKPDQPGYKYAQLKKDPTKQDVIDYLKLKTRPDFEKLTDKFFNRLMDHRSDPLHQDENYFPGTEVGKVLDDLCNDLWTTNVEPLQAKLDKFESENQKLREALRKIHSMSYYKLSPEDYRDEYLPCELFDEIEKLLKLDKTNP